MKNWTSQLDNITEQFRENFSSLSTQQLNWKPNAQTWSIAQNIHHLIVVNESYYPVLESLKKGTFKTPWTAKLGFFVTWLGKTVLNAVKPDRKKKMKTFPVWEPTTSEVLYNILEQFSQHQFELKAHIKGSSDLIESGTVISSPANKNIVYKLETAFDIIVCHEQRHLEQAKEVLRLLKHASSL